MSKNNVRIAIRDSTDSHNVAFFDNKAGIKYKSANLHRFLAGSASILTIKYNSKDIDSIRSGCKLAFRYKARDYWLNVMSFEKKGFEVELTAYSLGLELNNETRGEHKPANAMSIAEYVAYYDPEHALTIGVNEVSDKRIKLEWTGTDTILARLFSVANSFGAELDFSVELNDDYSLKRQVLNIYKKGNLGTNKVSQPVRVGKELKVINYSDNIKELRTAVRATGKDGLTIDGLDKKIYDNNKELLYYSSGMTVYAPQSRDRFPSVGKGSNDNWIVEDLGETQYETKEALWGYMYGEIQKKSLPEITYEVEGAIEAGIGDTQTLIDDIHFEPALYVQARVSELEDDILTGKVTKSTFINFERKYSQIADILLKQVEALAEDAAPYIIRLSTNNGYIFKNGQGTSTITAKLEKYSKIVNAKWKWLINNSVVSETSSVKINASQVNGTLNVVAVAIVGGSEAAREYITFTNVNDGPQGPQGDEGPQGPQGDEGPKGDKGDTGNGIANTVITYGLSVSDTTEPATWSSSVPTLVKGMYLWTRTVIIYTNGESTTSYQISYIAKDADATAAIDKTKQELLEKLDTVRNDSLAAVEEAKQELTTVADDLSKAKTDLQNAVSTVDTKATNLQSDLSQAKQDLTSQAQQLQAQANAQSELTNRVSSVEETANGTKTTVSELSKTVAQNGKDITSVTARTKVVEDDLSGTKTTLSQVKTTADSTSQKTATLETGLNGLSAKFSNLKIGGRNLLTKTNQGKTNWSWSISDEGTTAEDYYVGGIKAVKLTRTADGSASWAYIQYQGLLRNLIEPDMEYTLSFDVYPSQNVTFTATLKQGNSADPFTNDVAMNQALANKWTKVFCTLTSKETLPSPSRQVVYLSGMPIAQGNYLIIKNIKLEKGNVATDYSPSEVDFEQKVAEYKQDADQNYASLQSTVQSLDGTVTANKATADQTAEGFKTRIESLETYKNGEATRANQYFESAKTETARQLTAERTAIAKDYVAKSTYISDVTGIRNDLTATTTTANTTKTNLANYQASNDKAVANLQSNLQTANGNISSLKTKVEAVPGQITSAVSAVEGKIPTDIGTVNLIKDTGSAFVMGFGITNTTWDETKKQSILDFSVPGVNLAIKPEILPQNGKFFDFKPTKGTTYTQSIMIDTDATFNPNGEAQCKWYAWAGSDFQNPQKAYIKKVGEQSYQVWSTFTWNLEDAALRAFDWVDLHNVLLFRTTGTYLAFYKPKLTTGNLPSDWSPSPEDYDDAITQVKSEIKQTADGMTLLATKTELNTAKNELQSGINTATNKANNAQSTANSNAQTISTHTTQISALNTGLQAKVSQSEFNTLSGRVTTAENNIIAKANELSSKITTVEGKIPTDIGTVNLVKGTGSAFVMGFGITNTTWDETKKQSILDFSTPGVNLANKSEILPQGNKFCDFKPIKGTTYTQSIMIDTDATFNPNGQMEFSWFANGLHNNQKAYIKKVGAYSYQVWSTYTWNLENTALRGFDLINLHNVLLFRTTGTYLAFYKPKLTIGNLPSDWSPAPEDYDSKLSSAQSEIKQTTDAIKASVSSLDSSTVKSSSLTINADGIVMKAGKSTTDVANAIGSYFAVNQNAINLFSDKINVKGSMIVDGAITSTKIAAGAIDASKIAANAITANMITGGKLNSTNGATVFDLNAGTLTFNNNYGYIQRVAGDKIFEITTYLGKSLIDSRDYLTSAFNVRKSDNSRQSGIQFSLYNMLDNKPTATTKINSDSLNLYDSQNTILFSVNGRGTWLGNFNMQGWGDIPVAQVHGGLLVKDIGIGGRSKSLLKIVEELCNKAGIWWM